MWSKDFGSETKWTHTHTLWQTEWALAFKIRSSAVCSLYHSTWFSSSDHGKAQSFPHSLYFSVPPSLNAQTSAHIHTHLPLAQRTHMHTRILTHIYANTQGQAISQHPQSIRPLLIPPRCLVQCGCIYRSQASTLLFLQLSVLITFLCFLSR